MRGRWALSFLAVTAATVAATHVACTSFSGEDPALANEAGAADAPAPPLPDAAAPEAQAPPFCASHAGAGVCADFDEGDPVTFHFVEGTGNITVDPTRFVSPPASMKAVTTGADQAYVKAQALGPGFARRQRFSFDTYQGALAPDAGADAHAVLSSIVQGSGGCAFDIESCVTKARLNVAIPLGGATTYENFPLSAYPPPGRWTHVEVLLEMQSAVLVTVTIDKVVALDRRVTQCPALTTEPAVLVGFVFAQSFGRGEAGYDNVLLEAQ